MSHLPSFWSQLERPSVTFSQWRPLLRQLDDFFNDADIRSGSGSPSFAPACDIEETDEYHLVSFDVPGVDRDAISIEVSHGHLIVSGERRGTASQAKAGLRVAERRSGKFQRTIALPDGVKAEEIEAQYVNGVLTVAVPKATHTKAVKISVGEAKGQGIIHNILQGKQKATEPIEVKAPQRSAL